MHQTMRRQPTAKTQSLRRAVRFGWPLIRGPRTLTIAPVLNSKRFLGAVLAAGLVVAAVMAPRAGAQQPGTARPKAAALTAQDYIDIQQLLHRYAFALDTCSNNGYDYADLFTPDGVFYWGVGGRKSVGREQLAEAAGGGKGGCKKLQTATAANPIQSHMTVNAVIEASPEGAIGKNYLVYPGVQGIHGDGTHTGHVGGYQDVYVKTAQGWRFKKRIHIFPPDIPGTFVFPDEPVPASK